MSYKSPIEIITEEVTFRMEDGIVKAVQKYDISVNKTELQRALMYDRKQYTQGFEDGKKYAEAELVRHGEWILMERREPQYDIMGVKTWGVAYRCSECGFVHSVIEDFGHYVFCPNCGADMRGEAE